MSPEEFVTVLFLLWLFYEIFQMVLTNTERHRTMKCRACGKRVDRDRYREHRRQHYDWGNDDC